MAIAMLDFSLPLILSTFGIIFLAELPDKTALATLVLATTYKARDVLLGTWVALFVQTLVAVAAGSLLTLLPATPVRIASGIGFLVFSYMALTRKEEELEDMEEAEVAKAAKKRRPAWITCFLVTFAAEWGDLTQLATAALVARSGHPFSIGIGAFLALASVTGLAALLGSRLTRYVDPQKINIASGILFGLIGLFIIGTAFVHL